MHTDIWVFTSLLLYTMLHGVMEHFNADSFCYSLLLMITIWVNVAAVNIVIVGVIDVIADIIAVDIVVVSIAVLIVAY